MLRRRPFTTPDRLYEADFQSRARIYVRDVAAAAKHVGPPVKERGTEVNTLDCHPHGEAKCLERKIAPHRPPQQTVVPMPSRTLVIGGGSPVRPSRGGA